MMNESNFFVCFWLACFVMIRLVLFENAVDESTIGACLIVGGGGGRKRWGRRVLVHTRMDCGRGLERRASVTGKQVWTDAMCPA